MSLKKKFAVAATASLISVPVFLSASPAGAVTLSFVVTTTNDEPDVNPGDLVCSTPSNQCSLRAAFQELSAAPSGSQLTVTVQPGATYTLSIPGSGENMSATGDLDIGFANLAVILPSGPGVATITADPAFQDRAFDLDVSSTLYLGNIALVGFPGAPSEDGGAVRMRMATLFHFTDDSSGVAGMYDNTTAGSGGAIHGQGAVRLNSGSPPVTTILPTGTLSYARNAAGQDGGAVNMTANSQLFMENTEMVSNRAAGNGGAVNVASSNTTSSSAAIQVGVGSLFSDNQAGGDGGAINFDFGSGGATGGHTLTVVTPGSQPVVFSGNVAQRNGGAIHLVEATLLTNGAVTFERNRAMTGSGGAILVGTRDPALSTRSTFSSAVGPLLFNENRSRQGGGAVLLENAVWGAEDSGLQVSFRGNAVTNIPDENAPDPDPGARVFGGGAVGVLFQSDLLMSAGSYLFEGNQSLLYGGAVAVADGSVARLSRSRFVRNQAAVGGGAVATLGVFADRAVIDHSFFDLNLTSKGGGETFQMVTAPDSADPTTYRDGFWGVGIGVEVDFGGAATPFCDATRCNEHLLSVTNSTVLTPVTRLGGSGTFAGSNADSVKGNPAPVGLFRHVTFSGGSNVFHAETLPSSDGHVEVRVHGVLQFGGASLCTASGVTVWDVRFLVSDTPFFTPCAGGFTGVNVTGDANAGLVSFLGTHFVPAAGNPAVNHVPASDVSCSGLGVDQIFNVRTDGLCDAGSIEILSGGGGGGSGGGGGGGGGDDDGDGGGGGGVSRGVSKEVDRDVIVLDGTVGNPVRLTYTVTVSGVPGPGDGLVDILPLGAVPVLPLPDGCSFQTTPIPLIFCSVKGPGVFVFQMDVPLDRFLPDGGVILNQVFLSGEVSDGDPSDDRAEAVTLVRSASPGSTVPPPGTTVAPPGTTVPSPGTGVPGLVTGSGVSVLLVSLFGAVGWLVWRRGL